MWDNQLFSLSPLGSPTNPISAVSHQQSECPFSCQSFIQRFIVICLETVLVPPCYHLSGHSRTSHIWQKNTNTKLNTYYFFFHLNLMLIFVSFYIRIIVCKLIFPTWHWSPMCIYNNYFYSLYLWWICLVSLFRPYFTV